jgi:hypothetical protein
VIATRPGTGVPTLLANRLSSKRLAARESRTGTARTLEAAEGEIDMKTRR